MKIAVCDDSFEFRKELLDRIQQSIPSYLPPTVDVTSHIYLCNFPIHATSRPLYDLHSLCIYVNTNN